MTHPTTSATVETSLIPDFENEAFEIEYNGIMISVSIKRRNGKDDEDD